MEKVSILIVEDQVLVARHINNELKKLGYDVVGQIDKGEEVLDFIEKKSPDLILMDIYLAGEINGIEAAKQIKKKHKIPIIFLTDSRDLETFHQAKLTGPENYLTKPFNAVSLGRHIELALHKYSNQKEGKDKSKPLYDSQEIPKLNYFLDNTLYLKNEFAFYKINLENLFYIEGNNEQCLLKTKAKNINIKRRLSGFSELEKRPDFASSSNSYIVNLSKVNSFDNKKMILEDQKEIPMSDDALKKLKDLFKVV